MTSRSSALEADTQRLSLKEEEEEEEEEDKEALRRRSISEQQEEEKESAVEDQDAVDSGMEVVAASHSQPLFTQDDIENSPLLQISRLNDWDFPIFDLAEQEKTFVLSKVSLEGPAMSGICHLPSVICCCSCCCCCCCSFSVLSRL